MKKLICANWKMNLSLEEARAFGHSLTEIKISKKQQVILYPSSLFLSEMIEIFKGTSFALGGQDCSEFQNGSHTGQVSAKQLAEVGAVSVIMGHSERSQFESNQSIYQKVKQAQKVGLLPIVCVGEKEKSQSEKILKQQIEERCPETGVYVIAYEPLWAIGTGQTASLVEIEKVVRFIKNLKKEALVLYGGSVKPNNVGEILSLESLDGVLIGGASLKIDSFLKILNSA